jgi:hypothetical protein
MKKLIALVVALIPVFVWAQSIEGTWQQTESKTCFEANIKESDTEKELESAMRGSSASTVAKLIIFKRDGSGQEGIFSKGKKKGESMTAFKYKLTGQELSFLDKKSGIIIYRFVVDELTQTSLKIHDAVKDCETKSFVRVK